MARRGLDRAQCHQLGSVVNVPGHLIGLESAIAERHLAHLVSLASEQAPGEMVRAVLTLANDDVLPGTRRSELRRNQTGRRRYRSNQSDVRWIGPEQTGHPDACAFSGVLPSNPIRP